MQHLLDDSEISEQQNSFFKPPLGVNVTRKPKRSTYSPVFGQSGQTFGVRAFCVELMLIEK